MDKHTNLTYFTLANFMNNTSYEEIKNNLTYSSSIIPPIEKIIGISEIEQIDHSPDKIEFDNYAKFKYVEAYCWLVVELEKIIKEMVFYKINAIQKEYLYDSLSDLTTLLALSTNSKLNTNVQSLLEHWDNNNYTMPFHLLKQIMEKKGYIINSYSSRANSDVVKNKSHYNPIIDFHQKPIETFILKIEIKDQNYIDSLKKDTNSKKRNREDYYC
jgi:hypothetical protein